MKNQRNLPRVQKQLQALIKSAEMRLQGSALILSAEMRFQAPRKAKANELTPKVRLVTSAVVIRLQHAAHAAVQPTKRPTAQRPTCTTKPTVNANAAYATVLSTTRRTAIIHTLSE